jgi:hypothetical protein
MLQNADGESVGRDEAQATQAGTREHNGIDTRVKGDLIDVRAGQRATVAQPAKATEQRPMAQKRRIICPCNPTGYR